MEQEIKVGDGATYHCHNDSHAYTVVEVVNEKTLIVKRDRAIVTNGPVEYGDHVEYRYEPNPDSSPETITLRKDGRWRLRDDTIKSACVYSIGFRREYYNWCD